MEKLICSLIVLSIISLAVIPTKLKNFKDFQVYDYNQEIISDDKICLIDNIYHEAKGESLKGKLAVAQITLNRVYSNKFPNSICDVVYQRSSKMCQFSWTCNKKDVKDVDMYEESVIIANIALNGEKIKKLENSLFFHNVNVNPKWKYNYITKIGNHIFYGI